MCRSVDLIARTSSRNPIVGRYRLFPPVNCQTRTFEMGCGSSTDAGKAKKKTKDKDRPSRDVGPHAENDSASADNPLSAPTKSGSILQGKEKYLIDVGAVSMSVDDGRGGMGAVFLVFVPKGSSPNREGCCFVYRDVASGALFLKHFATDEMLLAEKTAAGVDLPWAPFFKSVASDTMKNKVRLTVTYSTVAATFSIVSSKDPKNVKPFTVKLLAMVNPPRRVDVHEFFVDPMSRLAQYKRVNASETKDKEKRLAQLECRLASTKSNTAQAQSTVLRLTPVISALKESVAEMQRSSGAARLQSGLVERKVRQRRRGLAHGGSGPGGLKHPLDVMYESGGPMYFEHLLASEDHFPVMDRIIGGPQVDAIIAVFPSVAQMPISVTHPSLKQFYDNFKGDRQSVDRMLSVMQKLDSWDMSVFDLERATNNNALFYVTYAMLYKLDLVRHFNIDDTVLRTFLQGVQAGYHPNPYHSATHAADVSQINYFIMVKCGLSEKLAMSKEELLAGIIAGSIHDYDHPGFNNSFHTRTNAYLSTLYNDKSILENHHLACIFEMLRQPKYNILSKLTDDQRREVRDTMCEMVLSTDMGNHGKIFQAFRRRQVEGGQDWFSRKEDVRLALSMSIKMADISNSGRPNHLYIEWAKNIATEFYKQGDAEQQANLAISPFMDRRKHRVDFPKGQQSFMSFIVVPMFEAMAELLPALEPALAHCNENKDYWRNREQQGLPPPDTN